MMGIIRAIHDFFESLGKAAGAFTERLDQAGQFVSLTKEIERREERLKQIESILPITKHSVRRKKLLQKRANNEKAVQALKARIQFLKKRQRA